MRAFPADARSESIAGSPAKTVIRGTGSLARMGALQVCGFNSPAIQPSGLGRLHS
jgi:hypothetical protein